MDEPIERETVGEFHARYACECGFDSEVCVYGLGQAAVSAPWGLWVDRAIRRAEVGAAADAAANADLVLDLTPCPACGHRPGARRLLLALALLIVIIALIAGLGPLFLPWLFASLFLTGAAVVLVLLLRFWVVGYWLDARQRVAFHCRPRGTQTVRIPVARDPHSSIAATLMLGCGALAGWFATNDAYFLLGQTEATSVACEPNAVQAVPADTWVRVEDCPIDYARFRVDEIGSSQIVYLPVGQPGADAPSAWLEIRHSEAEDFVSDPEAAEQEQRFSPPAGVLRDDEWGGGSSAARVITPTEPSWSNVWMGSAAAVILLPLAAVYWPRRKWTHAVV